MYSYEVLYEYSIRIGQYTVETLKNIQVLYSVGTYLPT